MMYDKLLYDSVIMYLDHGWIGLLFQRFVMFMNIYKHWYTDCYIKRIAVSYFCCIDKFWSLLSSLDRNCALNIVPSRVMTDVLYMMIDYVMIDSYIVRAGWPFRNPPFCLRRILAILLFNHIRSHEFLSSRSLLS